MTVRAYDPEGIAAARATMPDITYCSDAYDAAAGSDALVVVTDRMRSARSISSG